MNRSYFALFKCMQLLRRLSVVLVERCESINHKVLQLALHLLILFLLYKSLAGRALCKVTDHKLDKLAL